MGYFIKFAWNCKEIDAWQLERMEKRAVRENTFFNMRILCTSIYFITNFNAFIALMAKKNARKEFFFEHIFYRISFGRINKSFGFIDEKCVGNHLNFETLALSFAAYFFVIFFSLSLSRAFTLAPAPTIIPSNSKYFVFLSADTQCPQLENALEVRS